VEILSNYTYNQWAAFLLIMLRTGALFTVMPFFSSNNIPVMVKAGLTLALSFMLQPALGITAHNYPTDIIGFALLASGELMIGAIMGLIVRMLMVTVQIMGQLVGFQMGFAVANVIDPMGGEQISVLSQFCYLLALLLLFNTNAHLLIISSFRDSFLLVPPGTFSISQDLFTTVMLHAGNMFALALKMGAPVIGALLFTQVAMGVIAKTVPQMNILIVGMPLTISVGFLFLALSIGTLVPIMVDVYQGIQSMMQNLLRGM
jgi:flagellar biosynthetic protein FliR